MVVKFEDNSIQVEKALDEAVKAFLYEVGGEVHSQTQKRMRVDTERTKDAWKYVVDENAQKVTIGNPLENAIWEEFGTGEYALNGNGRKGGWFYKDRKTGKFIFTRGKTPRRAFQLAFNASKKGIKDEALRQFGVKLK